MTDIRVAVAQAAAVSRDVAANTDTALHLLSAAADQGAKLVVFPELFLCGYDLDAIAARPDRAAVSLGDESIGRLRERCAALGLAAVVGACVAHVEDRSYLTNSALVVDDRGALIAVYDKINLWTTERPLFRPGDHLVRCELAGIEVGLAICYDAGFPEHTRALARAGAELIVCPSAFVRGAEEHRYDLYYPMRALENTVYLAVANLVGGADPGFFGRGAIFDPAGYALVEAGNGEGVFVATIGQARLAAVREELRYLDHLQTELYAKGAR